MERIRTQGYVGSIDKIVIPSGSTLLQMVGNLGAMSDAAAGQEIPAARQSLMLVAGARNQHYLQLWRPAA